MILLLLLSALCLAAVAATATAVRRDGYRRVPTDPARLPARD